MRRLLPLILFIAAALGAAAPAAEAGSYRSCAPVRNPFAHTRYAGVDLTHIQALHVSCATARRVARDAERHALGITPSPSGIRTFTWQGWHVTGDLRPVHDRYVASKGGGRVQWRF
ncbi:MAG: hypothetical protein ACTHMY_00745 [Solirubrobacteraceae bacterium]